MATVQLSADFLAVSTEKILAAAKLLGIQVVLSEGGERTPCDLPVPVLDLPSGQRIRHTNAVLKRIGQISDSSLTGSSFIEEAQIDSWLEWVALEVDHHDLSNSESLKLICEALEAQLKSRTFLVGQRLTLADVSAALSLREALEKAGMDTLRETYPSVIRWARTCYHQVGNVSPPKAAPKASPAKAQPKAAAAAPQEAKAKAKAAAAAPTAAAAAPAAEAAEGGGSSKKDEKKKAKEEEKRRKEEEKKRKEDERIAAQNAKFAGPSLTLEDFENHAFGNLFIQSQRRTDREWTPVSALDPSKKDQQLWVRARVHNSRKQGGKLCFLTLRQDVATIQAVVFGPEIAGFAGALPDESVVDIYGKICCPDVPIASATQSNVELNVEKLYCIGRSQALPLQLADASRSEKDFEKDPSLVRVGQDVKLDNRVIDLRTVANQAIFRIQSGVCTLFREFLLKNSFQEIHTPKLIGGASEGGADVFRVDYFEGNAFLAQSPQLYKQMALMTDMPRVFEIGPIFRSEKSFTHRHMTEFTGLDIEMTFKDHYHEVLEVLDGLFNHIFEGLNSRFKREIDAVREQYPFEDLKWKYPCKRLTFKEAIGLLRSKGPAVLEKRLKAAESDYDRGLIQRHLDSVKVHEDEEDISTEDEKVLGVVMLEEFGEELYIIDKFPKDTRPFYTMPDPKDARWTNAYDIFLRGEEITSGAQRIHDPKMLTERCQAMGIPPESIQPYIDAFKYGSYPHAGAGIGMERVVMLFLSLNNIRKTSMFPRDPKRLTP
mmetsp:Transcript_137364/g.342578  ORF Transcript_137364/g.342578 Transcript_137364/m.342578 type:complete len:772 (-) Transcript_137364:118-2433(-)